MLHTVELRAYKGNDDDKSLHSRAREGHESRLASASHDKNTLKRKYIQAPKRRRLKSRAETRYSAITLRRWQKSSAALALPPTCVCVYTSNSRLQIYTTHSVDRHTSGHVAIFHHRRPTSDSKLTSTNGDVSAAAAGFCGESACGTRERAASSIPLANERSNWLLKSFVACWRARDWSIQLLDDFANFRAMLSNGIVCPCR